MNNLFLDNNNLAIHALLEQQDEFEDYPDDNLFVNDHYLSQQDNLLLQVDN